MIAQADAVVKGVIFILLFFSVGSWGIIFYKYVTIYRAKLQTQSFLKAFWANPKLSTMYERARRYTQSPIAQVFRAGYLEFNRFITARIPRDASGNPVGKEATISNADFTIMESVERILRRTMQEEVTRLESYLTFLATTASASPFIGLFGTVWGIMNAFRGIGAKSSASISVVASGISEALIATAIGLFAAIPAVIAYNYFISKVKILATEMDNFSSEFINILERQVKKIK